MPVKGALISAGAGLLGGILGDKAQSKANAKMLANAAKDRQLQRQFAKKGISWRVKDAQSAGIHPLYAMGANLPTYSPSAVAIGGQSHTGKALASAGQDIGRAVSATQTADQRALALENARLNNLYLEASILKLTRETQTPPAMQDASHPAGGGIPGQPSFEGRHPGYSIVSREIEASAPTDPSRAAGTVPAWGLAKNMDGSLSIVPGKDVKELLEDSFPLELRWMYEHIAKPLWNRHMMRLIASKIHLTNPPRPGYHWGWKTSAQKFVEIKNHRGQVPYSGRRTKRTSWEYMQPRTMRIPGKSGTHY